jgi:tRNA dimethylallyltransferase
MSEVSPLLVILGPTASGKSALGIELAERLNGEVIVCDSTQVYRHFDIGTGKVPASEQRGIPHHLVDIVEPHELFTAGEYRQRALGALENIRNRGKLPILTAGTGLYLRALLEGLADAPARSEALRERLREKGRLLGPESLHKLLTRLDHETAARIGPRDTPKIIRSLELRILTGKPVGEIHRSGRTALEGFEVTKIGLLPGRAKLYARIDARVTEMIGAGWVEEVRNLIASRIPRDAKAFQFIGYSLLRQLIENGRDTNAAIPEIQQATRQFAKRQITWFRKEAEVHWIAGFGDEPETISEVLAFAQAKCSQKR